MQRHRVNDQIELVIGREIQHRIIGQDQGVRKGLGPDRGMAGHDRDVTKGSVNLTQPILHFVDGDSMQKIGHARARSAVTVALQRAAIGQDWTISMGRCVHGDAT